MLIRILIITLCLAASSVAVAQTPRDMEVAASEAAQNAEAELYAATSRYRQTLSESQREVFDEAERAWAMNTQATCRDQSSGIIGSTSYVIVRLNCLEALARERIRYIDQLSHCKEGDLTCPVWNDGT